MFFLAGPRQVGKTTISKSLSEPYTYLSWDEFDHQQIIAGGGSALKSHLNLDMPQEQVIVFDEIHKWKDWKNYLKGIYDQYKDKLRIIVTGSSRLDLYQKGSDSLMGRYFPYRVHPLSIREIEDASLPDQMIRPPLLTEKMGHLLEFGGFPDPFIKGDSRFSNRWHRLRYQQLLNEDIRDMTQVQEMSLLLHLMTLLETQVGQLLNQDRAAQKLRVAHSTVHK